MCRAWGLTAVADQLSTYSDFVPTLSRGVGVRREEAAGGEAQVVHMQLWEQHQRNKRERRLLEQVRERHDLAVEREQRQ